MLGDLLGLSDGEVGERDGDLLGFFVGLVDGLKDGEVVGEELGDLLGLVDGADVSTGSGIEYCTVPGL